MKPPRASCWAWFVLLFAGLLLQAPLAAGQPPPLPPQPHLTPDEAQFRVDLPTAALVRVTVFDVAGRLVQRVAEGRFVAGVHNVTWDGTDTGVGRARAGVYFCRVSIAGRDFHRAIVMTR